MVDIEKTNKSKGLKRIWSFYISNMTTTPTLVLASFKEVDVATKKIRLYWDQNQKQRPNFSIPLPAVVKQDAVAELTRQIKFNVVGDITCFMD